MGRALYKIQGNNGIYVYTKSYAETKQKLTLLVLVKSSYLLRIKTFSISKRSFLPSPLRLKFGRTISFPTKTVPSFSQAFTKPMILLPFLIFTTTSFLYSKTTSSKVYLSGGISLFPKSSASV